MRKALCREMLEIRYELLKIIALEEIRQLKAHLIASVKAGFDPSQARVPAGNPNGGQWADNGFGGWKPTVSTAERLRRVDPPIGPSYVIESTLGVLTGGTQHFLRRTNAAKVWRFATFKKPGKWANQMRNRGWTEKEISDTIARGKKYPAPNKVNPGNRAIRYEKNGKYVVRDEKTKEILQISKERFEPNEVDNFKSALYVKDFMTKQLNNIVEIYVSLLGDDEGTRRPTQAISLGNNIFKVLTVPDYDPEDEEWEFLPDTIVRCEPKTYRGRPFLLAVEKVG